MPRNFHQDELEFFDNEKTTAMQNIGNLMGDDQYILDRPEMVNIRIIVQNELDNYLKKVYSPKNNLTIEITQSWLSWLDPGQYFHEHQHQNSLVSGCLYINANRNYDAIIFHKKEFQQIYIPAGSDNQWNTTMATCPVNTGDIVLFPSKITHSVAPTRNNYTRTTLAFNSFVRGEIREGRHLLDLSL
jgi:uncharacterized protein (TIGR02466 family)